MKKIFAIFVCMLTFVLGMYAQVELKMVQIDTTPISDVTKVNKIEMLSHEVTLNQYETVMGDKPEDLSKGSFFTGMVGDELGSLIKKNKKKKNYFQETGVHDNHPVIGVTFYDAIYFCNKLSKLNGFTPVYSVDGKSDVEAWGYTPHVGDFIKGKISQDMKANGYRLPKGIEWLYAAKGNQELVYPGSDNIDEVAWYSKNTKRTTMEVAQKKPNAFGLYDMVGNVEELIYAPKLDYNFAESNKTSKTPRDPLYTPTIGKSFKNMANGCKELWYDRNIYSSRYFGSEQREDLGFRVVRSIVE